MNERCKDSAAAAVLFLVLLGLYLSTCVPALLFEDTGEFATGAAVLGVAHPPGYPLFLLLGHLWSRMPFAETGFALAAFSAATAAAGCVVVFAACRVLGLSRVASFVAGIVLGSSRTLWSQAVVPEVYGLNVLLTGAMVYTISLLVRKRDARLFPVSCILLVLCFLNHYIAFFTFLPVVGLAMMRLRSRDAAWRAPLWAEIACAAAGALAWAAVMVWVFGPLMGLKPVWGYAVAGVGAAPVAFAASLLPWVRMRVRAAAVAAGVFVFAGGLAILWYLPMRAAVNPALNWGNHVEKAAGFAEMLRRSQFMSWENQLAWFHMPTKWAYFMHLIQNLPKEFSALFVFLGILGVLLTAMERRRLFLFLGYLMAVQTVGVILFINFHFALHQIFVFRVFYIGAYLVFVIFAAAGIDGLLRRLRESAAWAPGAATAALILVSAWPAVQNLPYNMWQRETRPLRFARDNFRVIRRDGLYFMQGAISVPVIGYAHVVENDRRDILLIDNHGTMVKENYSRIGHEFSFVNMSEIFHDATLKAPFTGVFSMVLSALTDRGIAAPLVADLLSFT